MAVKGIGLARYEEEDAACAALSFHCSSVPVFVFDACGAPTPSRLRRPDSSLRCGRSIQAKDVWKEG